MYTTDQSTHAIHARPPKLLSRPTSRRPNLIRAVRTAHRTFSDHARLVAIQPAALPGTLRDSADADISSRDLIYFPGRLTKDAGPEWYSERVSPFVRNVHNNESKGIHCPLATWDPEDFESDFDRFCDSSVTASAIADAARRRFPLRDFAR